MPLSMTSKGSTNDARASTRKRSKSFSSHFSRTGVNFFVDLGLLVEFVALAWLGVVLRFVFPPGTSAGGWQLWGFGYDDWANLQFGLLSAMALTIVLHVMLHWSWVCGVIANRLSRWTGEPVRPDDGVRTLYGVATLIAILNLIGALTAAAVLTLRPPG